MDKNPGFWSLDKNGVVISNTFDYWKIPGPYEDSDAWLRKRIAAAIMIQKHTRRKIAQRTAKRMRQYAKEKKEFWTEQDKIQKANSEARIAYEIQRRLQPQTEADFDVLNKELETWQNAVEFQTLNLFQTVVTMLEILFLEGETRLHIRFAANILYATARQTQNLGIERLISYS